MRRVENIEHKLFTKLLSEFVLRDLGPLDLGVGHGKGTSQSLERSLIHHVVATLKRGMKFVLKLGDSFHGLVGKLGGVRGSHSRTFYCVRVKLNIAILVIVNIDAKVALQFSQRNK